MFSISNETKRVKITLLILLSVFFIACIFTSLYYGDKLIIGNFEEYNNDDVKYLRSAETFLKTGMLTYKFPDKPTVFIMPGITILLTPFVAIFGVQGAVFPVRVFFALLQTFNLFMVFLIARKIFSSCVAVVAVLLSIFYLPNIYVSAVILTEPIAYTAFLLLLYIVMWGTERGKKRYFIVGGIVWGMAVMFRPTMAAFPAIVFFYWLFKKVKLRQMVHFALCAVIPFVIILSPWVIRNYIVFDRFIPLTLSSGNPKLQGTIIGYLPQEREKVFAAIDMEGIAIGDDEISNDIRENQLALRSFEYNIKNNTVVYILWYTIGKTLCNFAAPYIWYPIFTGTFIPIGVYHLFLIILFVWGAFKMIVSKKITPDIWLLLIAVIFFNCIHLPYYCFPRYVYPVISLIIMVDAQIIYNIYCEEKENLLSKNGRK